MYTQRLTKLMIVSWLVLMMTGIGIATGVLTQRAYAQPTVQQNIPVVGKIYLPMVAGGRDQATQTATPTPTATTAPDANTPTPTPTATPPTVTLPDALVGTWFTGNAPLNDFYNPTTGEWREVNGIGQMYVFAANGDYTYTAFARFQTGACRSEVSVYKQGTAVTAGTVLTVTALSSKTRTVVVCPTPNESITEGSQSPETYDWAIGPNEAGVIKLTLTAEGNDGPVTTEFYTTGMAESLLGVWSLGELRPDGFYDPTTKTFRPDSPVGAWYDIAADATYRHGEHDFSNPNAEGCILEGWVYETGTINVVGGVVTITPSAGILRYINSCDGNPVVQEPWVNDPTDFSWGHLDLTGDIKLVLVRLLPFGEYIFHR